MARSVFFFLLTLLSPSFTCSIAYAEVRLPKIFTDNMVLQREMPIAVWGWAGAKKEVTVTLAGQSVVAKANGQGKWRVDLPAMSADGRTYELTVQGEGSEPHLLRNVVLGEVTT